MFKINLEVVKIYWYPTLFYNFIRFRVKWKNNPPFVLNYRNNDMEHPIKLYYEPYFRLANIIKTIRSSREN